MPEPTNHTEIHKMLKKHVKVVIRTQTGILKLIKEDGRYYYEVNQCVVSISEKLLNEIVGRFPENIGMMGWE